MNLVLAPDMDRYGVDAVAGLIAQAAKDYPKSKFLVGSCYELPFPEGSFDLVVSFGLLQIVSNRQRFLHELVRVTKPGGGGLIEFIPGASLLDLALCVPWYLFSGQWSEIRSLSERFLRQNLARPASDSISP